MIRLISCIQLTLDKAQLDFFLCRNPLHSISSTLLLCLKVNPISILFTLILCLDLETLFKRLKMNRNLTLPASFRRMQFSHKDLSCTLSLVAFHLLKMLSAAGTLYSMQGHRLLPELYPRGLRSGHVQALDDHILLSFKSILFFY